MRSAIEQVVGYDPFVTNEQMLAEGSLRGLIVENEKVEQAIENLVANLDEASNVVDSIDKFWKAASQKAGVAPESGNFGKWIGYINSKIDESRNDVLTLNDNTEGAWDKIKSFFGFTKNQRVTIEKAAERVIIVKSVQDALNGINNRLVKMTKNEPIADESKLAVFIEAQLKSARIKLGNKINPADLDQFVPWNADIASVMSKLDRATLNAGSNILQSQSINVPGSTSSLAAPAPAPSPAAPASPATSGPAVPSPASPGSVPARGATPAAAATPATPGSVPAAKIKKSELIKVLKRTGLLSGFRPGQDGAKVKKAVEDYLQSKGIQLESFEQTVDSILIERINRMAGLPYTEE